MNYILFLCHYVLIITTNQTNYTPSTYSWITTCNVYNRFLHFSVYVHTHTHTHKIHYNAMKMSMCLYRGFHRTIPEFYSINQQNQYH